jgi:hypothetical protein
MVATYCLVTLKMMEDHMHINCEMIHQMFCKRLEKEKVCVNFVSQSLTDGLTLP